MGCGTSTPVESNLSAPARPTEAPAKQADRPVLANISVPNNIAGGAVSKEPISAHRHNSNSSTSHAIHARALPELPSAITLAAAFNDVAYFKSLIQLIEAKHSREAKQAAHQDAQPAPQPAAGSGESRPEAAQPAAGSGESKAETPQPAASSVESKSVTPQPAFGSGESSVRPARVPVPSSFGKSTPTIKVSSLATYVDKRVHGDDVLQIACAAGSAEVVQLFLDADPSLISLAKQSTGNTLLHYAALGPPHIADLYKAVRIHLLHNAELLQKAVHPLDRTGTSTPPVAGQVTVNGVATATVAGGAQDNSRTDNVAAHAGVTSASDRSASPMTMGVGKRDSSGAPPGTPVPAGPGTPSATTGIKMSGLQYLQSLFAVQQQASGGAVVSAARHKSEQGIVPGAKEPDHHLGSKSHDPLTAHKSKGNRLGKELASGFITSPSFLDLASLHESKPAAAADHHSDSDREGNDITAAREDSRTSVVSGKVDVSAMFNDLAARFRPRSVERTIHVLLDHGAIKNKKNAFGRTPRDIAAQYADQIMPEATVSALSAGSLLTESTLWERLLHLPTADWDEIAENLLFDATTMAKVAAVGAPATK